MRLRVLTYNVHKFYNISRKYTLDEIRKAIHGLKLDIVFLQEVRGLHPEKLKNDFLLDPLEHFADSVWKYHAYGKNAIYPTGHHGNAILSKYPISKWENLNISNHSFEQRGFLYAEIQLPQIQLKLACTHFDLSSWGRSRQLKKVLAFLKAKLSYDEAMLIAGDFNERRHKITERFKQQKFLDVLEGKIYLDRCSYPNFLPCLPLDKIYFRNTRCSTAEVLQSEPWVRLSDHLPILAEFEV